MIYRNLILLVLVGVAGCAPSRTTADDDAGAPESLPIAEQGGGVASLHLPVADGELLHCVQGAHGSYSHHLDSTRYDLDFDTPNDSDEDVLSPSRGIAYVHADPTDPFGIHVNIDQGDGTYDVIGHCKEALVETGDSVAHGQLVCVEGCTGSCTGDHIHIGRHEGDASRSARHGRSIPHNYAVREGVLGVMISSEEFVCGLSVQDRYESLNVPARGFPNGTLVKTADAAPVYLIENGARHWIVDETVFYSHGYAFTDVVTVSKQALACYANAAPILEEGVPDTHSFRHGALVKEQSSPVVYAISHNVAMPFHTWETFSLMGYAHRPIEIVADGAVALAMDLVGSCESGVACIDETFARTCGGLPVGGPVVDEPPEHEPEETPHEWEPQDIDLASLIQLDGGEFGLAYAPPKWHEIDAMWLEGEVTDVDGVVVHHWQELHRQDGHEPLVHVMHALEPGDTLRFSVALGHVGGVDYSCMDDALFGTAYAQYDVHDLDIEVVPHTSDEGCDLAVTMPMIPEYDPEPEPEEEDETEEETETNNDPDGGVATPDDQGVDEFEDDPQDDARVLTLHWFTPFQQTAERITLSGEYLFADGTYGYTWHEIQEEENTSHLEYILPWVESGDTLRFSVEFVRADGSVSWSCIGPYDADEGLYGTTQGTAIAAVDEVDVPISTADDPTSSGCGLILTIP